MVWRLVASLVQTGLPDGLNLWCAFVREGLAGRHIDGSCSGMVPIYAS